MNAKKEAWKKQAETIIKNLSKRNMEGYYCETSNDAVALVLDMMEEGAVVTAGGSQTFKQSGMQEAILSGNFTYIDRNAAKTPAEKKAAYQKSVCADYFFMSSNALTLNGELVNIDGSGNRLACLIHGPEHVVLLVGMNKIVPDVESGIKRVQNMASPANAARLGTSTPCGATGRCGNCNSPDCMCCHVVVTRHSRQTGRIKVVLIGEELGY